VRKHGDERFPFWEYQARCIIRRRLRHAVYDTRYHLVWVPKYRKWILKGDIRKSVEELFREIMASMDIEVMEMEVGKDHVHLFVSIPPKYSVGEIVRKMKSISASGS